jgi:hypothetical protein
LLQAPELPIPRRGRASVVDRSWIWFDPEIQARVIELESEFCTVRSVVYILRRCDLLLDLSCHLIERDHSRVIAEHFVDCCSRRLKSRRLFGSRGRSERIPICSCSIVSIQLPPCHLWLPFLVVGNNRRLQVGTESKTLIVRRLCQLDLLQVFRRPVQKAKNGVVIRPNVAAEWMPGTRRVPSDLSNVSRIHITSVPRPVQPWAATLAVGQNGQRRDKP